MSLCSAMHTFSVDIGGKCFAQASVLGGGAGLVSGAIFSRLHGRIGKHLALRRQKAPERLLSGVSLAPARSTELSRPYVFVHGSLGWHVTWGVVFDVSQERNLAYETYGAKGDSPGAFGRMKVPRVLRTALGMCGVEWKGLWKGDLFEDAPQEVVPRKRSRKSPF